MYGQAVIDLQIWLYTSLDLFLKGLGQLVYQASPGAVEGQANNLRFDSQLIWLILRLCTAGSGKGVSMVGALRIEEEFPKML